MKKKTLVLLFCLIMAFSLIGCKPKAPTHDIWTEAIYTEDQTFGEGSKTIVVEVKAQEKSVNFTIHTDGTILGDILLEHGIIKGEEGPYGLYFEEANGIVASYEKDKAYWSFCKDGAYMNFGVDGAEIADGDHYELVYTVE